MKFALLRLSLASLLLAFTVNVTGAPTSQASAQKLPDKPGEYRLRYRTMVEGKRIDISYLLRLPTGYDTSTAACPVLVFMHGAGECGIDWNALYIHGPLKELHRPENKALADSFPFILIAPQCPPRGERWDLPSVDQAVVNLLKDVLPKLRADQDRVYLSGLSMGGKGAWLVGSMAPEMFAVVNPIASYADLPQPQVHRLKDTGVWLIAGTKDADGYAVSMNTKMFGFLLDNSVMVRNTIVPDAGHEVWEQFYPNAQFYETLLGIKRLSDSEKQSLEGRPPYIDRVMAAPKAPGRYHLTVPVVIKGQPIPMDCSVFVPKGYHEKATDSGPGVPLVVFLHEYGVVGRYADGFCLHGVDAELEKPGNASMRDGFPAVVLSPLCPAAIGAWDEVTTQQAVLAAINSLTKTMNIDPKRIYLTGLNEGAVGAVQLAALSPKTFAGCAPMVAAGYAPTQVSDQLKKAMVEGYGTKAFIDLVSGK